MSNARVPRKGLVHSEILLHVLGLPNARNTSTAVADMTEPGMRPRLRLSNAAVEYIRHALLSSSGSSVVVIVPELIQAPGEEVVHLGEGASVDELVDNARRRLNSLPAAVSVRWSVGSAERTRFPPADIHLVDGVEFYLPLETISAVGECELIMRDGMLRFDPEPAPFQFRRDK